MSKHLPKRTPKHISKSALRKMGTERAAILADLSVEAVRNGRDDRAARYVALALRICGKAQVRMPEGFVYCKKCLLPMLPGVNCRVRLTGMKVVTACGCGAIRRIPYIREKRR